MNTRIVELWENSTGSVVPREGKYTCVSSKNINDFAELIIRECVRIADNADETRCEWIGGNILMQIGTVSAEDLKEDNRKSIVV